MLPLEIPELHVFPSSILRIVCISDTHNDDPTSSIPFGDIFIHSGDMTEKGTLEELKTAYAWISTLTHRVKVIVAGNHEPGLDDRHSNFSPQAFNLFTSTNALSHGIHYLCKETKTIAYCNAKDPHQALIPVNIYGNPSQLDFHFSTYGNTPRSGSFNYPPFPAPESVEAWSSAPIPPHSEEVQIWAMHCPPLGRLDATSVEGLTGCEIQARAVSKARPMLAVFGHYHYSHGVERVRWKEGDNEVAQEEILMMAPDKLKAEGRTGPGEEVGKEFNFAGKGKHEKLERGKETVFVNAAWVTMNRKLPERNLPIVITLDLD